MHLAPLKHPLSLSVLMALVACGGGGGAPDTGSAAPDAGIEASRPRFPPPAPAPAPAPTPAPAPAPTPTPAPAPTSPPPSAPPSTIVISDAQRIAAATSTAESAANACDAVRPFYWELGNKDGRLVAGSLTSPTSTTQYSGSVPMSIASASKWVYGSYVAQKQAGQLSADDRRYLAMRAGYVSLKNCDSTQTVDSCLAADGNGTYTAAEDGKFHYDGGHMQKHGSLTGLGGLNNKALTSAVQAQLGTDVPLMYSSPQLAGGLVMSPDAYAKLMRKMLGGQLKIGALLGSGAVCTNAKTCGSTQATFAPIPLSESWHYAVAHWVEDDPVVGDGAFSSPGAFGFYPWIDATKTYYGVVARMTANGAFPSVQCGRLIRKAWATGIVQ